MNCLACPGLVGAELLPAKSIIKHRFLSCTLSCQGMSQQ